MSRSRAEKKPLDNDAPEASQSDGAAGIGGEVYPFRALEVANRFLEVANQHERMQPLLESFVGEVADFTGCAAVGIRILDDNGMIPYQAYRGFSRWFYESENPLSINDHQCICINVAKGVYDPALSCYTKRGSFFANGTTRFLEAMSEEDRGRTRNVCNEAGYESVALMPIRVGGRILGLIHVADPREDAVPLETVLALESAAMQLGTAIARVRATEALHEREAALRSLLNAIPESAMLTDAQGRIVRANDETARRLGLTPDQLVGARAEEILPSELARSRAEQAEGVLKTGKPARFMDERSGRFFENHMYPVADAGGAVSGVAILGVDVTEHMRTRAELEKHQEDLEALVRTRTADLHEANEHLRREIIEREQVAQALRESEERYRTLVEFASDAVFWVAPDGTIRYASPAWEHVTGYPPDMLRESPELFDTMVLEEDRAAWRVHSQAALADQGPLPLDMRIVTREGRVRWVSHICQPVHDDAGSFLGVRGSHRDITVQKQAQDEAKLREMQLVQADKMASLGVLVSGVAHEINNPNHAITANATLLRDVWSSIEPILERFHEEYGDFLIGGYDYKEFREQAPHMLATIVASANRIQLIIGELREFARGGKADRMGLVDVNSVVRSANVLVSNMTQKATRRFEVRLGRDLPKVRGHFQRLEQVVINLVQNACQALPDDDRAISITTRHDARTKRVAVEVRDEGVGMSRDQLKRICDPFYTTKRGTGGSGLGLWISSGIAQEHGGRLHFDSVEGHGTTATVWLPAQTADEF